MKQLFYSYPPNPNNIINWMYYNEEAEILIVHNFGINCLDFFNKEGKLLSSLNYYERFNITKVYKAIDHHPVLPWISLAGNGKWMVFDYQKGESVIECPGSDAISGINFSLDGTELWVIEIDKGRIDIYNSTSFEKHHSIAIKASLAFPTRFHPSGEWFTYAELEDGGTRIMFGNSKTYELVNPDTFYLETASYNITGLTFSPDGNYLLFTDEGIHVYEFPSLKKTLTINAYSETVDEKWKPKQFPDNYWSCPTIIPYGYHILTAIKSGQIVFWNLVNGRYLTDKTKSIGDSHYHLSVTIDNNLLTANKSGDIFWIDPTEWLKEKKQ